MTLAENLNGAGWMSFDWLARLKDPDVPTFLFAQALGLVGATALFRRQLRRAACHRERRLLLAAVLGCVIGGALFGPLLRLPRTIFAGGGDPFAPGWPMAYGALIGAAVSVAAAAGSSRRVALDAFAPAAGVLIAAGRLGCLAAGCCFGEPTTGPWGVVYPPGSPAFSHHAAHGLVASTAPASLPVVPVPALEVLLGLLVAALGMRMAGRRAPGSAFAAGAGVYALGRLVIEVFRGDPRPMAGPLSLPQAISLMVLATAAWWLAPAQPAENERSSREPNR